MTLFPAFEAKKASVDVLEVTLVHPEPPRLLAMQQSERQPRETPKHIAVERVPKRPKEARARVQSNVETERTARDEPRVLALPQTNAPPEPAVTVPPSQAATPSTSEVTRQDVARAAPSSSGGGSASSAAAGPVTPPLSNAAYLNNPAPAYPPSARRRGEQGTVMLKVFVTREGVPASVAIERTSGSAILDQAALETVKRWRFVPARQGTQRVEAWVIVPIVFKLQG